MILVKSNYIVRKTEGKHNKSHIFFNLFSSHTYIFTYWRDIEAN